jgi:hypothetical protein
MWFNIIICDHIEHLNEYFTWSNYKANHFVCFVEKAQNNYASLWRKHLLREQKPKNY